MSREVRRVPMDWQHPMCWLMRRDRGFGGSRMQLVPKGLNSNYADSLAGWEQEISNLRNRTGWDWEWAVEYHLTGHKGVDDSEPIAHPFYDSEDTEGEHPIYVRDEDHLHELLLAALPTKPNPDDYMPDFADHDPDSLGYCMYETCSEGTPISPVMDSPESLARWLADGRASTFGHSTGTYEQWLAVCRSGWAPSAVGSPAGIESGVEFIARTQQ